MRFCGATAFENLGSFKDPWNGRPIGAYGIYSDARNNLYLLVFRLATSPRSMRGQTTPPRHETSCMMVFRRSSGAANDAAECAGALKHYGFRVVRAKIEDATGRCPRSTEA
jgi:hypothetical protein